MLGGEWLANGRRWRGMALVLMLGLAGCGQGGGRDGAATAEAHPGEATYTRYCFSCHAAGIAGAPRAGDAEQWAPRVAKGRDALLASTIAGIAPGMPARGLCNACTDEDLGQAIDYMIALGQPGTPTDR
ncbi:MAG: c-type cytochrome [Gammaproteobacteria bacterium]